MPLINTRKVVGYTRVSTPQQVQDSPALENQAERIRAWARWNRLTLLSIYEDVGSARRGNNLILRPELQQAIDDANREGADLVVTNMTRLSRNQADIILITQRLQGRIVTVGDRERRAGVRSQRAIRTAVAKGQVDADALAERTSSALQRAAASGRPAGSAGNQHAAALSSAKVRGEKAIIAVEGVARVLTESLSTPATLRPRTA